MPDKKSDHKKQIDKDWSKIAGSDTTSDPDLMDEDEALQAKASVSPQVLEHPDYAKLEEQLTTTEQEKQKYYAEILRLHAEIANIRKRSDAKLTDAHQYAIEKFVVDLLPVMDGFEKVLEQPELQQETVRLVREGIDLTMKLLLETLAKFGVQQLNPVGQEFDPQFHEAMGMQDGGNKVKPNTILHVFQRGYTLHNRLLRPARVTVAK